MLALPVLNQPVLMLPGLKPPVLVSPLKLPCYMRLALAGHGETTGVEKPSTARSAITDASVEAAELPAAPVSSVPELKNAIFCRCRVEQLMLPHRVQAADAIWMS